MANTKTQQKKKWPIVLLGVLLAVLVAASALLLTKCNGEEPPVNKLTGELTQALAQEGDGIIELEEDVSLMANWSSMATKPLPATAPSC